MMYGGFLVGYTTRTEAGKDIQKYSGPYHTIQKAYEIFDEMKSNEPGIRDTKIFRLVYEPYNDKLY